MNCIGKQADGKTYCEVLYHCNAAQARVGGVGQTKRKHRDRAEEEKEEKKKDGLNKL
jgi:hypothetical protein